MSAFEITSPKRSARSRTGWEAFYSYYASFPEAFARAAIASTALSKDAVVFDPWNGAGTSTGLASRMGYRSVGFDLNPVMLVLARSRLLPLSEAGLLAPLCRLILNSWLRRRPSFSEEDPLTLWFDDRTACSLRMLERGIAQTLLTDGDGVENMSSVAATFYAALFATCREFTSCFRSSNPTWLKTPPSDQRRSVSSEEIKSSFRVHLSRLGSIATETSGSEIYGVRSDLRVADSTSEALSANSVDLVLTSPPYCTRIDYVAATRIELAILSDLSASVPHRISRSMIGTTKVPRVAAAISEEWGPSCLTFLSKIAGHESKASTTYYLKSHIDYFDKIYRSLKNIAHSLKSGGDAIFVVQDSHYKDVLNDVPTHLTEMCGLLGMVLSDRRDFESRHSMARVNPRARAYRTNAEATEAVLCFKKATGTGQR